MYWLQVAVQRALCIMTRGSNATNRRTCRAARITTQSPVEMY